jgi:hypothetical protein
MHRLDAGAQPGLPLQTSAGEEMDQIKLRGVTNHAIDVRSYEVSTYDGTGIPPKSYPHKKG